MNHKTYKKVALVIFDGFGVASAKKGNAIAMAEPENLNYVIGNFPSLTLQASGPLVGLPWGEMGNSEVGHLNIGAGRIVGQDLPRITNAIISREFFHNEALLGAIKHAKSQNSAFHIIGLISPGGVHSLDEHVYALLGMAQENHLTKVFIHMFTDGRDTSPKIALESVKKLEKKINEIALGKIATIAGRFYAMDRGGHYMQTDLAYKAMVEGAGEKASSAGEAIQNNYSQQIFDEMIRPTVILDPEKKPIAKISDNDSAVFINFRQDRALQLTKAFVTPEVLPEEFRHEPLKNLFFVTMTEYTPHLPVYIAFNPVNLKNCLSDVLSDNNMKQFHISESEKYAHVTSFLNCGRVEKKPGEEWEIISSPADNAHNYSDHPEMSSEKLADILVEKITGSETNFFVANFANTDMVGHTGNLQASIAAVACLDSCVKKILQACLLVDAALIITSDHGNVEQMINSSTGDIDKDHTTNPVPFLLAANEFKFKVPIKDTYQSLSARVPEGVISDIAPTILELFNLEKPEEMTGINLLNFIDQH